MPKIKYIVVDTAGFIENAPLHELTENVVTIEGVLNEIKSKRQIRAMVVLPYDIIVQEPTAESIRFVGDFAKKTGDYASLSLVDLKIIALTYQLEKEHVGVEHLKKEPVVAKTVVRTPNKAGKVEISKEEFFPSSLAKLNENEEKQEEGEKTPVETLPTDDLVEKFGKLDCEVEAEDPENEEVLKKIDLKGNPEDDESEGYSSDEKVEDDDEGEEEEEDDGWITPSNVRQVKKEMNRDIKEEKPVVVACMTTDFSVQNVIKQIGLNLSTIDGRVIKEARTFILRCYACFRTTTQLHKVFCPRCGHKTLKRCAVSIDENGQQTIHINMRKPITAKGKNKSLPRPRGGKHSTNPILFEDQPMPKQMPTRVARTKTNALDDDYIAGYSPFVVRDVDSRSALLRTQGKLKDWMRNNEFQNTRRGKKF